MERVTIVMPPELRARIEAERTRLSDALGAKLSTNAALQALLQRALTQQETRPTA